MWSIQVIRYKITSGVSNKATIVDGGANQWSKRCIQIHNLPVSGNGIVKTRIRLVKVCDEIPRTYMTVVQCMASMWVHKRSDAISRVVHLLNSGSLLTSATTLLRGRYGRSIMDPVVLTFMRRIFSGRARSRYSTISEPLTSPRKGPGLPEFPHNQEPRSISVNHQSVLQDHVFPWNPHGNALKIINITKSVSWP